MINFVSRHCNAFVNCVHNATTMTTLILAKDHNCTPVLNNQSQLNKVQRSRDSGMRKLGGGVENGKGEKETRNTDTQEGGEGERVVERGREGKETRQRTGGVFRGKYLRMDSQVLINGEKESSFNTLISH